MGCEDWEYLLVKKVMRIIVEKFRVLLIFQRGEKFIYDDIICYLFQFLFFEIKV